MRESLSGLRVLDLTSYLSGPFATLTLAGLGAEVIKIERREGGDPSRTFPPFCGATGTALREPTCADDESIAILKRNRGKKSLTLNLEVPQGKSLFLRLVEKSDVVIENLAPGVLEKWGLGYASLSEANPRIVLCSISGYGRFGPKTALPAFDPIVQASSLTMATNGYADRPPTRTGISFGDTVPSLYAVIGILAALRERDRTGHGSVVDVAMHDSLVAMLMVEPMEAQVQWGFPLRTGSRIPRLAPCNVYRCRDGFVALNAAPPRVWKRLAELMGKPELRDPALVPLAARLEKQDWIDQEVAKWVEPQAVDELIARTGKQGVPCARVAESLDELIDDTSLKARGMLHPLEHPLTGVIPGLFAPGVPILTPGEDHPPLARAPRLGEHTHEILSCELGLTAGEIRELEAHQII
ncbi:MAG: CoA transferase [Betaproteobacteria bacterium]|nr:CoA transferase [Betaproteobacteria bacterium]